MSVPSSTPTKRSWGASYYGDYPSASQDLMDRFNGVVNVSFQGPFLNDEDDLTSRLFKLAKSVSTHTYCLVPIDVPGANHVWDITYLSNADFMVWKFVIAIASGSMLFELVGTLRNAPLPSSYPIGMKVRLDDDNNDKKCMGNH